MSRWLKSLFLDNLQKQTQEGGSRKTQNALLEVRLCSEEHNVILYAQSLDEAKKLGIKCVLDGVQQLQRIQPKAEQLGLKPWGRKIPLKNPGNINR